MNLGLREFLRSADQEQVVVGAWALLLAVAGSDGEVSDNERTEVERQVRERFHLSDDDIDRYRRVMGEVDGDPDDIETCGRYLRDGAPLGMEGWLADAVQEVAWADGRPDMHRMRAMLRVAEAVHFSHGSRRKLLKRRS